MTEGQSPSEPRFCRQCGGVVPDGTSICPRCGQRWYMDRTEQRGVDLWQKIIEKRSAAGLGEPSTAQDQQQYRCPNCMVVLKSSAPICPHCGKSTLKAKIVPPGQNAEKPEGTTEDPLNLPEAAKGLASIKGATQRAQKLRSRKRLKTLDIAIVVAIVVIMAGIGFLLARQYGLIPSALTFFKSSEQQTPPPASKPVMSNVAVSDITTGGAAIAWTTDIPAKGKVLYGKSENYGMSIQADNQSISQKISLTNLEPGSTYHFLVLAIDNDGKELSRNNDITFSTLAQRDNKPPVISQFKVVPSDIGAIITWVTDKPSTSQVLYGTNESTSNSTSIDSRLLTVHSIRLSALEANTKYYYRTKSADSDGNEAVMNPPDVFITLITVPMGSGIGNRAPDFTLPIFKSQDSVALRTYRGNKVLLTFWAVYCPECDRELSLLQSLKNKNIPGVTIIAVFLESKPDDIEKTIAKYKAERGDLTVPIVVDMYKTAAHMYNVEKVPCTFFIDRDMIIRDIEYGNFNIDQVERTLRDL